MNLKNCLETLACISEIVFVCTQTYKADSVIHASRFIFMSSISKQNNRAHYFNRHQFTFTCPVSNVFPIFQVRQLKYTQPIMIVHLAATQHIAEDSNFMFKGNKATLGISETAILQPKSLDLDNVLPLDLSSTDAFLLAC